jgi:hypothetical protein
MFHNLFSIVYYTGLSLSTVLHKEVSSTPSSPQKEMLVPFKRSVSAPGGEDEAGKLLDEPHTETFFNF